MKRMHSTADLAVNGAPPAFDRPLHVGRPNIGDRADFIARVDRILDNRWLTNDGPLVREFEAEIATYLGVKHCVAMCNGTIALEIAIRALGLQGEVIVPSYTFIATAHALYWQGVTPVFADIAPHTHSLDPAAVERRITSKTTGIIGVHLWGRAADIVGLAAIAEKHRLALMFDAAHAFGCSHEGTMIGNFGACEVLSFHATKFFNTFEGGAIVTNDDTLAAKARLMRNFGFAGFDNVVYPGTNGKMTEICAAMGLTNLEAIDDFVEANRRNYLVYLEAIAAIPGLSLLTYNEAEKNNYQYIVVEVDGGFPLSRDEIITALHAENILARKYFWPGCHRMKPYSDMFPQAGRLLENTEKVSQRVMVLPTGCSIGLDEIARIIGVLSVLSSTFSK